MHRTIEPAILYFGTPVVLISTLNEDGTPNLAPMSSAWWLGWSCQLGLDATSKTTHNLQRTGECVLNLPSPEQVEAVNRLAKRTGARAVPMHKKALGYRHLADKFGEAGLTPVASETISVPRAQECPVQLEAVVSDIRAFGENDRRMAVPARTVEVQITRVHVDERILFDPERDHIDPDRWEPLVMNFREFYGTRPLAQESRLARGSEDDYAPWKQPGLKRVAVEGLLRWAYKGYR